MLVKATNQATHASQLPDVDATLGSRKQQVLKDQDKSLQNSYSASFRASWELDLWQKLASTRAASEADLQAAKFDLGAAKQSIIGQVLLRYLDIQQGQELVYWSKQNLASQQRRVDITAQRLDSGLTSSQDYRLALNSLHSIQAALSQQRLNLNLAKQRFNLLLGKYPSTPIENSKEEIGIPKLIEVISPKQVLQQRHDLVAAEYRLLSAHYRSKEADKGYLPDINIGANIRANREELSQLFDWKYWLATLTADLVQPIFNNGTIDADIKLKQARQDLALAQYQQTLLTAWQEIEQALYAERIQRQRFVALDKAFRQIHAAEKRTIENYQNGLASSFELLNLQTRRINAKVNLIRSRFAILSNRVNLILALGEPFPIARHSSETL
ncbi:TolC family protein [Paraglaciecola aquimarina]|uniref:TolC family protein n=1 Tax=Paraglaciecola aquimarina TaxID=1235557 RepID=A0ABU3SVY0_9ALTE|nr:TolC family protein [Paraglaciecola aquimarina]MDU0354175.1 TolC family protein [Paraglaciecola aquimarina]